MFPAPSPNTQAIFNLQSGVATPSTAEFQQTSLRAAAQANQVKAATTSAPTSQPDTVTTSMGQPNNFQQPQPAQRAQNDQFSNHDVSNAANDLLSFATQSGNPRNGAQPFAIPNQPSQLSNVGHMPVQPVDQQSSGRRNTKGSIISVSGSADTGDQSESGHSEQAKTNTRSRGRKIAANSKQAAGTKRKADEAGKGGGRKKTTSGPTPSLDGMDEDSEEETSPKPEDGKKMTDEEKRKNFLERNRLVPP